MAVSSITPQDMQRARRPKPIPEQPKQMLPDGYTAGKPRSPRTSTSIAPNYQGPAQPDGRDLLGTPKPVVQPGFQGDPRELLGTPKTPGQQQVSSITPETPSPTVATTDTPVITRTPGSVEPETMGAPDYSAIQDLDQNGLQDYIDIMSVRVSRGQALSEQEQLNLMKANRMLQAQQGQTTDPYADAIASGLELKASELERVKTQADEYYQGRQGEIESMAQRRIDEATQAGEKTQQAVSQQLSFSGFGRSTYAGEKQAEVQQAVNRNIETAQSRRDAELARAQAERDGASAEVIARYDTYIDGLRTESTKYNNELVQQMNEYNQQNTANYQDKVNNILQLAQTMGSGAPLTEEETALANSYATLAIDSKGDLNNTFLSTIPPTLLPAVLAQAAQLKGAIVPEQEAPDTITGPDGAIYARDGTGFNQVVGGQQGTPDTIKGPDGAVYARDGQGFNQVIGGEAKEANTKTYKSVVVDGTPYSFDETTGQFTPGISTGGATGDLRHLANQFPGQAWAKNNNPAGITWNGNFDNPKPGTTAYALDQAGVQYEKGTARPASEGGNYVTFPTIEDGLKAQRIIMEQTYGDSTVSSMLGSRVGTGEAQNYAKQVSTMAGVNPNVKVSDLSEEELSRLQQAKIKKESPGLGRLLEQQPEQSGSGEPEVEFDNQTQAKGFSFATRMQESRMLLDKIEDENIIGSRAGTARKLSRQKILPNALESQWYQSYQQAQRDFINSVLRQESGAAIAESEFDSAAKQYFAQPGDSKETIEQKRKNRENTYSSLVKTTGQQDRFDRKESQLEDGTTTANGNGASSIVSSYLD